MTPTNGSEGTRLLLLGGRVDDLDEPGVDVVDHAGHEPSGTKLAGLTARSRTRSTPISKLIKTTTRTTMTARLVSSAWWVSGPQMARRLAAA